jgi:hypothetical protein
MKIIFYIVLVFSTTLYFSCNKESVAKISGPAYQIPENPPVGIDISHDISRIRNLYTKFNKIACKVVENQKIAPEEVYELNKIVSKLKYFEVVYSQKFFEKEIQQTAYSILMSDPESNKIISEYIFLTSQLQDVEGRQFLNL